MNRNILIGIGAFLVVAIVVVLIIVFAGRGDKTQTKELVFPKEPVTLTYWRLFDDEEIFKEILQEYRAERPNVTIQYVKKDYATYEQDLLNALAAGTGPDIFILKHDFVPKHLDKLTALPEGMDLIDPKKREPKKDIPTQFKELYVPATYQDLIVDNKVYGVPLSVDSLALYYNSSLIETSLEKRLQALSERARGIEDEAEQEKINQAKQRVSKLLSRPPDTWTDFIEVVKLVTEKDARGNITQPAVAMGTAGNVEKTADILSLLMLQNNTQMVTAEKQTAIFNLSTKKQDGSIVYPGTTALDFYTSFARPSKETYTYNSGFPNSLDAFGEQKVPMMFQYSFYEPHLKRKYPDLKFEIAPMPQIQGIIDRVDYSYYWAETASKSTPYPVVAWDFLKFVASKENVKQYTSATERPTSLKEIAKQTYSDSPSPLLKDYTGKSVYTAQAFTATNWYKGGEPTKIEEIFKIMIDGVVSKNQPFQTAIDTAAASVTNILQTAEPLIERKKEEPS